MPEEGALLFPLYLWSLLYFIRKESWLTALRRCVPFCVLAVLHLFLWFSVTGPQINLFQKIGSINLSWTTYTATLLNLILWYTANLFYPDRIVLIFNLAPQSHWAGLWTLTFLCGLLCLFILIFRIWKKNLNSFALTWFLYGFQSTFYICIC